MVALLKDENRLKEERLRAVQAKNRQGGISSDGTVTGSPKGTPKGDRRWVGPGVWHVRPSGWDGEGCV